MSYATKSPSRRSSDPNSTTMLVSARPSARGTGLAAERKATEARLTSRKTRQAEFEGYLKRVPLAERFRHFVRYKSPYQTWPQRLREWCEKNPTPEAKALALTYWRDEVLPWQEMLRKKPPNGR